MNKYLFCVVRNKQDAESIVEKLREEGFNSNDISILCGEQKQGSFQSSQQQRQDTSRPFSTEGRTGRTETAQQGRTSPQGRASQQGREVQQGKETQHGKNSPTGLGGSLNQLTNMGTVNIPNVGSCIATGFLLQAVKNTTALATAFTKLGITEAQAKKIADKLKQGTNILLAIQANNSSKLDQAKEILEENNATEIFESAEKVGASKNNQNTQQKW